MLSWNAVIGLIYVNKPDAERKYKKMKKMYKLFTPTVLSSADKWGGQLKTTKRDIRDFMILELKGIKNYKTKI